MKKIAIVGGGIAGLTAAWLLHKKHHITLFEKSARVGGWIQSIDRDGFLFERGPRGFLSNGTYTLQLCDDLSLNPLPAYASAKKRYILLGKKLQKVSIPLFLRHGGLSIFREPFVGKVQGDETIADFFKRRFSSRLMETFIDPLVSGIFGGDPQSLSMQACFSKIKEWENHHGSVVRGFFSQSNKEKKTLLSFEKGMETLTKTLHEKLDKHIHLNQEFVDDHFDHIIMATPQSHIPHLTLTVVNLGWNSEVLPVDAFGYLVPRIENDKILGVTFDSKIFKRKGTICCVMLRGVPPNPLELALDALQRHLNILVPPHTHDVLVAKNAIPQYGLNHSFTENSEKITYISNRIGINATIEDVYAKMKTIK